MQTIIPRSTSVQLPDATLPQCLTSIRNEGWHDVKISGDGWKFTDDATGEAVPAICKPGQTIICRPARLSWWRRLLAWLNS